MELTDQNYRPSRSKFSCKNPHLTASQRRAMWLALKCPLIMRKIVNTLDLMDLKVCRRVNKNWKYFASKVIHERDSCHIIRRSYSFGDKMFCKVNGWESPEGKFNMLVTFTELLDRSTDFPCSHFTFRHGNLKDAEVGRFFRRHGANIKTLSLEGRGIVGFTSKKTFCKILDLLPNLETLHLAYFDYDWKDNEIIHVNSLKSFSWIDSPSTALKILNCAPNLKIIPFILNDQNLNVVQISGKIKLVKEFNLFVGYSPSNLETFASLHPKLCYLNLAHCGGGQNEAKILAGILESSKQTLVRLNWSAVLSNGDVLLPTLTGLKELSLVAQGDYVRVFPVGTNLAGTFPNLEMLDCSELTAYCRNENWDKFVPQEFYGENLPTVKKVKINHSCTEFWMSRLKSLCPNFKMAHISGSCDATVLSRVFKQWRHLEGIQLELKGSRCKNKFAMDSQITGISPEICQLLWAVSSVDKFTRGGTENVSRGISILDLTNLRHLQVRLSVNLVKHVIPFSHVSGLYAFRMMPQLRVLIQLDLQKLDHSLRRAIYEELAGVANIQHCAEKFAHKGTT